jgi:hypothetical protein
MGSSKTTASRARSRLTAALGAALSLALAACASEPDSKRRPDPPGGGVDPATITPDNLKMGGDGAQAPPERVESASPSPNPSPIPAAPGAGASPAPATGSTAAPAAKGGAPAPGSFKMTAEHCKELGRKFEQLTLGQGGGKREAKQIGDDFAAKCTKDKAGEMQEKREYDCILAVKSVLDIQGCK